MQIRKLLVVTKNCLPPEKDFPRLFVNSVSQKLYHKINFEVLNDHFIDTNNEHFFMLIKKIIGSYYKIRINNLAKKITERAHSKQIRQQFNKLILFNNQ